MDYEKCCAVDYEASYKNEREKNQHLENENRALKTENKRLEVENAVLETIIIEGLKDKYIRRK